MSKSWVSLHSHSEYSALDGASRIPALVARAVELGHPAQGISDHGSCAGHFKMYTECKKAGIKPILGAELYMAPGDRTDKKKTYWGRPDQKEADLSKSAYTHLSVFAQNSTGLQNLYIIQHDAYQNGFYHKARSDFQFLANHGEGLIVLSGCASGAVATRLRLGQHAEARETAQFCKDAFPGRYYIELMSHGIDWEEELNLELIKLSEDLDIPLVMSNDEHYVLAEDESCQHALLSLQTFGKLKDGFSGSGYHLRSREEMEALGLPQEALDNTLLIADMVESYDEVFEHKLRMPMLPDVPDEDKELVWRATKGLARIIPNYSTEYAERLGYELQVISRMGYSGYFLVLGDIVQRCRERGINPGPGRGSGAASLVAYALGITGVDPIRHSLVFERFLNPSRTSLPDIDVDFPDDRRQEVLEIVREEFGNEYVAQIGTFSRIGAKAAIQDATRVLGYPVSTSNELKAKLPPATFGRQPDLASTFVDTDSDVLGLAFKLEGLNRQMSQHAGGVVISPEPLIGAVPLWQTTEDAKAGTGANVLELDMHDVEDLGYVKLDLLGLNTLGVINECERMLLSTRPDGQGGPTSGSVSSEHNSFCDSKTLQLLDMWMSQGGYPPIPWSWSRSTKDKDNG